ncbi:MAG: hypothetical protein WC783_00425 [Candidatus Paceibacterota bacterium]
MPQYVKHDLWDLKDKLKIHACITINGFVKKNGEAVMGRGCAYEASQKYPGLTFKVGSILMQEGDPHVNIINSDLIMFPVKPRFRLISSLDEVVPHQRHKYKIGDRVPGFACIADIDIIEQSCVELKELNIPAILPFPGIGYGFLDAAKVKEILDKHLSNKIVVVYR